MQIYNTTTNEVETLAYYDRSSSPSQQQDSAPDITAGDPNITFNADDDRYEATGEAIAYWRDWFDRAEKADDLERELRQMAREEKSLGWMLDRIEEVNREAGWAGFDTVPTERTERLMDLKNEAATKFYAPKS